MKLLVVPPRRLLTVFKHTLDDYNNDDVAILAAAITYFGFSSLFPLFLFIVALAGLFMSPVDAARFIYEYVAQIAPDMTIINFLSDTLNEIIKGRAALNGPIAIIGLIGLFFSASGVFNTLDKAINRAWGCEFAPTIIQDRIVAFVGVIGVVVVLIASLALASVINSVQNATKPVFGIVPGSEWIWAAINLVSSLILNSLVLTGLYRAIPRCKVGWREVWLGGVLAAILWELLKQAFALYLGNFANYGAVYGTLGTLVALLTWIWLSCQVLLLGAEFASQYAAEYDEIKKERVAKAAAPSQAEKRGANTARRIAHQRRMAEEIKRRDQERPPLPAKEYVPLSNSFLIVFVAALAVAVAGLATRLARLLLRRD